jgi:predicted chitinase
MVARSLAPSSQSPAAAPAVEAPTPAPPALESAVGNAALAAALPAPALEPEQGPLLQEETIDQVRAGGAVLEFGDRGPAVSDLQRNLTGLGYGVQTTGVMGDTTQGVLRHFQAHARIAPTGELGPTTLAGLERSLKASVTLAELRAFAPEVDERTARTWLPYLNQSMAWASIDTEARKAAYLAQLAHETDHFRTFEEYASGAAYEGRDDLGNTRAGDGVRYKGRGAIQLTGRTNYREIGQRLGVDFEKNPELLEKPEYAFLASADYWKRHDLNRLADRGDFEGITDVINYYDPEDRRRMRRGHHARAKGVLADHRALHARAPGTIGGGPAPAPAPTTEEGAAPWWDAEEPEAETGAQPAAKQTQYAGWFDAMLEGRSLDTRDAVAKDTAAYRVAAGMEAGARDPNTAEAGLMWQMTDAFSAAYLKAKADDWAGVQEATHRAAQRARELRDAGLLPANRVQDFVDAMGERWTEARKQLDGAKGGGKGGATGAGGAGATPIVDQHRMNHERNWAFCGIATLLMTLEGNGKDPGVDVGRRADLAGFASGIYVPGAGSSGAGMAARMREYGLGDASFSTGGRVSELTAMLAAGKPVPVGFVSMGGTVQDLPQASARYGGLREGDRHAHTFGASGHWATVVGFEGPVDAPTHFLVNDPDTGAQLRMTRAELERHTAAHEGIWRIRY